ncbi:type VI secretion system tube protein TssD [Tenacibaculum maritimum]|uniref:type VI secretion system tube protein TssD n=1 Tax=Tenacibaculum maritimum TaxID=107401 RepID=UPI003876A83E
MNIVAKLCIGREERNLLSTQISYERKTRITGKPASETLGGIVKLVFTPRGDKETILRWMFAHRGHDKQIPYPRNLYALKKAKIIFYQENNYGEILFTYKLEDCTCIAYKETFDALKGMRTEIKLSAAIQYYKTTFPFIKSWRENWRPPIEYKPLLLENKNPSISYINWVNTKEESIDCTEYATKVGVKIQLANANGGTVTFSIQKKDGTPFNNNLTEIHFTEEVQGDSLFIKNISIEKNWFAFKKSPIDELIVTAKYQQSLKKSNLLQLIPPPKVLVNFRPHSNWKGEFGFDWIRTGDTSQKGDTPYKDIIGNYTAGNFTQSDASYNTLKKEFNQINHPIKIDDKYTVPVLTLFPNKKATLSLKIEIKNANAKKIIYKYNTTYFKLNKNEITHTSIGKKELSDCLTIECIKEFKTNQFIEVIADGKFAGKLKILANDKTHRYTTNIVFVKVKTELKARDIKEGSTTNGKSQLTKYLSQTLTKATYSTVLLDLSSDTLFNQKFAPLGTLINADTDEFQDYLNAVLEKNSDIDYSKHYKIYFIDEEQGGLYGRAYNIPAPESSRSVIVLRPGLTDSTLAHETFHAMGLYHTFDNHSNFTFQQYKTDNIMDYSDIGPDLIPVISTYQWQWNLIQSNIEKE